MIHGRVIDELWATVKHPGLNGMKLLVVRPEGLHAREDVVAADLVSAGRGDWVVVAEGRAARMALGDLDAPIEAVVVALVDEEGRDELMVPSRRAGPTEPIDAPNLSPKAKKTTVKKNSASKVQKKAASSEKGKARASKKDEIEEVTQDLFPADDREPEVSEGRIESVDDYDADELVVEVDDDVSLPSFDDVDAIWADEDDEDLKGS